MCRCEDTFDALLDYVNERLSQSERCKIALHLSECKYCRAEIASLIKLKQICAAELDEVPTEIVGLAFKKIPKTDPESLLRESFNKVCDSFVVLRKTMRLAKQLI